MRGDPIESMKSGIRSLHSELMGDPSAVETASLSIITFAESATQLCALTPLAKFSLPHLLASRVEETRLGGAFRLLENCLNYEVELRTCSELGDWKPLVFVLIDGMVSDMPALERAAASIKDGPLQASVIGMCCGEAYDPSELRKVTDTVLVMKDLTLATFAAFFKWVDQEEACL